MLPKTAFSTLKSRPNPCFIFGGTVLRKVAEVPQPLSKMVEFLGILEIALLLSHPAQYWL